MAEGAWDHTANLMAAVINAAPFREGSPVRASQFNPYAVRLPPAAAPKMPLSAFKASFIQAAATQQKKS
jgi:hypothetical protein